MSLSLRFAVTRLVGESNDDVWSVLGDFGREHRWTATLSHCTRDASDVRIGTVRTCILPRPLMGRTEAREELTEFEPGRALAYSLDGAAGPFAFASSRWTTRPLSDHSTAVTVEGRFTPRNAAIPLVVWPFAKPMLQRLTRRILRELEAFLQSQR